MTTPDPFEHAPLTQRLTYLTAAMRNRLFRQQAEDPLAKELAETAAQVALELEIAQGRLRDMYYGACGALRYLDQANPERSSDMRALEGATRELKRIVDLQHGAEVRVRLGVDGSVHPMAWTPDDPFIGGDGRRTVKCVHCGRACGDPDGGAATVNNLPVCAPYVGGRPNCFRAVTVWVHPVRDCDTCTRNDQTDPETEETMP